MKRIFTCWAEKGSTLPSCLSEGVDPPRFMDGTADPRCAVVLWRVEVGSFEEAQAIRNLRYGWEPAVPTGEAQPCPDCGAVHYPEGSGQCWNCSHQC